MKWKKNLGSDDKNPSRHERDMPPIKSLYNVKDINSISRTIPKSASSISKYRDENVFLHVKGTWVQREVTGPEPQDAKLG
jgi:hypothetical protein